MLLGRLRNLGFVPADLTFENVVTVLGAEEKDLFTKFVRRMVT